MYNVAPLLTTLDHKLIELLHSLTPEEWNQQTVARLWKVKDVVAHLLDTNLRVISIFRDHHFGEQPGSEGLVPFLNRLNADWVQAMKRVSPAMLITLHEMTGPLFCNYLQSLDPMGLSPLPVAWAGESESRNWMEIAREYTEKWLHQQQIRDAVGKPGIMTREFFYPFINIFMFALPYTYSNVIADDGTIIKVTVDDDSWLLAREGDHWLLKEQAVIDPATEVILNADTAWKLFSKSWRPEQIADKVIIKGNRQLGEIALTMVSVMA
jgi:uncharacterized protein (TIGR03083 family)